MTTELERIADKARREPTLQFTSLAHHLTPERLWQALHQMASSTAPGVDGVAHDEAVETFPQWSQEVLNAMHRKGVSPAAGAAGLDSQARKSGQASAGCTHGC